MDDGMDDGMDDRIPATQPAGALVPPPRVPPTAIATSAPLPPEPRIPGSRAGASSTTVRYRSVELFGGVLDALDRLGDRIAQAAGLR